MINNISEKIKSVLIKYPKIYFFAWCLKYINDEQVRKFVLCRNDNNATYLRIECHGNLNKDKNILFYDRIDMRSGFFSMFNSVLRILYVADKYHLTPVIKFAHNFLYAEEESVIINGTTNPWEYYFQQTSDVTVEEAYASSNVIHYDPMYESVLFHDIDEIHRIYIPSDLLLATLGKIYKRYIKLNKCLESSINHYIAQLLGNKKTLGVHARGTDMKVGLYGHPICITPDEYFDHIACAIEHYNFEQIFLATDDIDILYKFINKFGYKLVYFEDVIRTIGDVGVHTHSSTKEKYKLGFEVLRDVYALVSCSGFIAGLSNVSRAVQIIKAGKEEKYKCVDIIVKGLHKNKKITDRFVNNHYVKL